MFHHLIKLGEHGFLDANILKHRLNHEVSLRDIIIGERRGEKSQTLLHILGFQAAFLDRGLVILGNGRKAAIQRLQYQPGAADGCEALTAILRFGVDFNFDSAVVDGIAARAGDEFTVLQNRNAESATKKIVDMLLSKQLSPNSMMKNESCLVSK